MDIHIHRDGEQQGPYTLEQVNGFLAEGLLQATDLAFHEGLTDWVPLGEISGTVLPETTHIELLEPETANVEVGPAQPGGKRRILVLGGIAAGLIAVGIGVWFLVTGGNPEQTQGSQTKTKPTKKTEPAPPKEATNPWDTPARLALFLAQRSGSGFRMKEIVPALAKLEDKEKGLTYLKMAVDIAQKTEHPQEKVTILTNVALAQAKAGDKKQAAGTLQQATEVARTIEGARGEAMVLQISATGLVLNGDIKQSLEVAQQMVEASRKGDRRRPIFTPPRAMVTFDLILVGNTKQALEVAQKMTEVEYKAEVLMHIALAQVEAGDKQQASATLKQAVVLSQLMKDDHSKVHFLVGLSLAQVKAGDKQPALDTLKRAMEAARKGLNSGDTHTSIKIALALAEVGDKQQASAFLKQTLEAFQKDENSRDAISQSRIASALFEAGDKQLGMDILKQAMEAAQKIEDLRDKTHVQGSIAEALAKAGNIQQALEYAQKIEAAGGNEAALNGIAGALVQAGDFKQAWGVIKRIEDVDRQTSSLSVLAPFLAIEPISITKMKSLGPLVLRLKKAFTTEEKQIAKELVEVMREAGERPTPNNQGPEGGPPAPEQGDGHLKDLKEVPKTKALPPPPIPLPSPDPRGAEAPAKEEPKAEAKKPVPPKIIPQARPIFALLEAVKNSDQKQLKTVFCEMGRKEFEKEGWDKVLAIYQEYFKKAFGDYKLEDFTFEYKRFEGEDFMGMVSITRKGKKFGELMVIKENAVWKMAER